MTPEEIGTEITNLKISISGYVARVEAQNTITNNSLDAINQHLSKLNSKVATHEAQIIDINLGRQKQRDWLEAYNKEDFPKRIVELETKDKIGMSLKSFVIGCVVMICTVIGAVAATTKIIESHQAKIQKPQTTVNQPLSQEKK